MFTVYLKIMWNYKDYLKIVGNDKEVLQLTAERLLVRGAIKISTL